MITSELISYIKKQINNNISRDLIILKLTEVGWYPEDINDGFLHVESELKPKVYVPDIKKEVNNISLIKEIESPIDNYREPLETKSLIEEKLELSEKEVFKIEDQKIETPKTRTTQIETFNKELSTGQTPETQVSPVETPEIKIADTKTSKVWIPMVAPIKYQSQLKENINKNLDIVNPKNLKEKEELIPTLTPKKPADSHGNEIKENLIKIENPVITTETPKNSLINNLPQSAMLSSYQSDLSSIKRTTENVPKKYSAHRNNKWIILGLIFIAIALIGGLFIGGYINIKNFKIPFIKEDPRVLLLNNSKTLSSLKSYKTETNIEISSPSFASITYGLMVGNASYSSDKDSISMNTLGIINQNEKGLFSDNFITVKSSVLQDSITADIKNDGNDLFISASNLSQIIKENTMESPVIKINKQQFNLIPSLFSTEMEKSLNKINLYEILSSGMSSFVNNDTLVTYDEFINNVEITQKGQENIKGIDTYHYSINPDRQLSKKLLSKISDNFVLNLATEDQDKLNQILGSITVNSLEVWIGKGDNNIYQYNVVLDIPLSKVIGFEDKSIGNNLIKIAWKTTYYDFNITNNVLMPEKSITATDFVNYIKEEKMKNDVSSFKQLATNLKNAEGVFGSKSNGNGSCMSPVSGSLFSPLGHTKGSMSAVGSISELLNKIMIKTNNVGYCYSTSKDWSFTIPIFLNYDSASTQTENKYLFCVDSTGAQKELINPPTGAVCK